MKNLITESRVERIQKRISLAGQTRFASRREGRLANNPEELKAYAQEQAENERAEESTSLFVKAAPSVEVEVILHFSRAHPKTAEVYVDGNFVTYADVRANEWGNRPCTVGDSKALGAAIDGAGAVGRLSLSREAYNALRIWKGWDEKSENFCEYPSCGRAAQMLADQGMACDKHYNALC